MGLSPGEWPAKKVRDTFLDFFKDRSHSFGIPIFSPPFCLLLIPPNSPLILRCPSQ